MSLTSPLPLRRLLGQSLVAAAAQSRLASIVARPDRLEVDLSIAAELASPQVFGLVLNDHFFEEMVLLIDALLVDGLGTDHVAGLTDFLGALQVGIQILQVNLVAVLVFEGVQAAIGALLEQELAQVARWDEVVRLGLETAAI